MNTNKEISLEKLILGLNNFIFCLNLYKEKINKLNVFPVPDGDTGTNMLLTMKSLDLSFEDDMNVEDFLLALKNSSLMEARGNSGVILSQFFLGLLSAYKKNKILSFGTLADGFVNAARTTRESLPNPVEGTLLSIYEDLGSKAIEKCESSKNLSDFLRELSDQSIKSVKETPNKLEILREADVVDSGGLGFAMMINAWFLSTIYINQDDIEKKLNEVYLEMISGLSDSVSKDFYDESEEIEWGNCTVFTVKGDNMDISKHREIIPEFGKSAVITGDSSLMKIHIHVLETDPIIEYAKKIGVVENIFIQNMDEQTKEIIDSQKDYKKINTSILSICEGKGIINIFNETAGNAMHVLIGGPKKNPSINDILEVIEDIKSKNIIILPNNPNILVTVKKLIEISDREGLGILETKSIQQGISSLVYFDDSKTLDENISTMEKGISSIEEASITKSTRDVKISGKQIKKDQYIAILNDEILDSFDNPQKSLEFLLSDMSNRNEILTVIVGHDSIEQDHKNLEESFYEKNNDNELTIVEGNQPYYNYFILGE